MASTGIDFGSVTPPSNAAGTGKPKEKLSDDSPDSAEIASLSPGTGDKTHRRLKARHIQLIGR